MSAIYNLTIHTYLIFEYLDYIHVCAAIIRRFIFTTVRQALVLGTSCPAQFKVFPAADSNDPTDQLIMATYVAGRQNCILPGPLDALVSLRSSCSSVCWYSPDHSQLELWTAQFESGIGTFHYCGHSSSRCLCWHHNTADCSENREKSLIRLNRQLPIYLLPSIQWCKRLIGIN